LAGVNVFQAKTYKYRLTFYSYIRLHLL